MREGLKGVNACKICGGGTGVFLKGLFDDRHGFPGRFDIYRCGACGFCQTTPEIPEDKIGDIYTRYYPRKNINVEEAKARSIRIFPYIMRWWAGANNTAHYHIKKASKVLDIGCGDCTSIREINAMGAEGYGIEPDRNISPIADALGLKVHIGLFHEIPYEDGFFDYITMSQVLEHIHDPVGLLVSLKRILKDGGRIIIGVPNVDSRLRKKYGSRWLNWHVPYHINHFSKKSLETLAERSGCRISRMSTITPNLWVVLQERLADYPVKEGVRVPFMNGEEEPRVNVMTLTSRVWAALKARSAHLNVLKVLFLRLVDAFGKGESYLVVFEKKR